MAVSLVQKEQFLTLQGQLLETEVLVALKKLKERKLVQMGLRLMLMVIV